MFDRISGTLNRHIIVKMIIVMGILLGGQLLIGALVLLIFPSVDTVTLMVSMIISFVFYIIIFGYWYIKDYSKSDLIPRKGDIGFFTIFIIFLSIWSVSVLSSGITALTGVDQAADTYYQTFNALGKTPLYLQVIGIVILGPISEELVFRGIIFKDFRKKHGFILAALVSSFAWGFAHMNLYQGLAVFPLGILLAYIYEKFEKMWVVMLGHSINNLISVFATYFLLKMGQVPGISEEATKGDGIYTLIVGAIFTAIFVFLLSKSKYIKEKV